MTTDNFCFYLQNRLIKPVKQEVNSTVILPPLVFPGRGHTSLVCSDLAQELNPLRLARWKTKGAVPHFNAIVVQVLNYRFESIHRKPQSYKTFHSSNLKMFIKR